MGGHGFPGLRLAQKAFFSWRYSSLMSFLQDSYSRIEYSIFSVYHDDYLDQENRRLDLLRHISRGGFITRLVSLVMQFRTVKRLMLTLSTSAPTTLRYCRRRSRILNGRSLTCEKDTVQQSRYGRKESTSRIDTSECDSAWTE